MADSATLTIPVGYQSDYIYAYRSNDEDGGGHIYFYAGVQWVHNPGENSGFTQASIVGITGSFPIAISGNRNLFIASVMLRCVPTVAKINAWKQSVFTAIMSAYENKLAEYRNALDEAKAIARNEQRSGTNPLMNEQIIRSELKKMCMYSFVKDAFFTDDPNNPWDVPMVGNLGFWNTWRYSDGFPEYNLSCDAKDKFRRERMAFLEQAFDWDLLVAEFLPYYYAQQPFWKKMYQLTDNDPTFLNFLQSGLAKVRVPVKVGKAAAVLRFWQTQAQEIQQGNEPYLTADPYVQALLADIKRPAAEITVPGYDVRNLNSWIVRIPTTLTMLEEVSNGIVQSGIPCACGDLVNDAISMPCIETGKKP